MLKLLGALNGFVHLNELTFVISQTINRFNESFHLNFILIFLDAFSQLLWNPFLELCFFVLGIFLIKMNLGLKFLIWSQMFDAMDLESISGTVGSGLVFNVIGKHFHVLVLLLFLVRFYNTVIVFDLGIVVQHYSWDLLCFQLFEEFLHVAIHQIVQVFDHRDELWVFFHVDLFHLLGNRLN